MMLKRIKKFKLEIINKTWVICDKERKTHEIKNQVRRHDDNKHIKCFFLIIAKLDENIQTWMYEIEYSKHNHVFNVAESHSILRRMIMIDEIKNDISRQLIVRSAFFKVLFTLRLDEFANVDNSMIKSRDIYNLRAQLRRDDLRSLTLIQILIRELKKNHWTFFFQKNSQNQIIYLFFVKNISKDLLKFNFEVLMMNCMYKINKYNLIIYWMKSKLIVRYKMSFFIISEQIALHINFYVVFCFISKKKMSNYNWALNQLKTLYKRLKLFNLIVFVIDMKKELITTRYFIFSD
jgi:hypothetical protein